MNKQDTVIVVLLFSMLIGWFVYESKQPDPVTTEPLVEPGVESLTPTEVPAEAVTATTGVVKPEEPKVAATAPVEAPVVAIEEPDLHVAEEKLVKLLNEKVELSISSWGACVKGVRLLEFREELDKESDPISMEFNASQALAISGIAGLSKGADFEVVEESQGKVVMRGQDGDLTLTRTIEMGEGYDLAVKDVFSVADGSSAVIPAHLVEAGSMTKVKSKASVRGMTYISIDSAPMDPEAKVIHWSKTAKLVDDTGPRFLPWAKKLRMEQRFDAPERRGGCGMFKPKLQQMLLERIDVSLDEPTQWVGVKNKFFLSILTPTAGSDGIVMGVRRQSPDTETVANSASWEQTPVIEEVSAQVSFNSAAITDGVPFTREYTYFVGPKKYAELKKLGDSYGEIMQFGFWSPLSRILLTILNAIHGVLGNYGVAIILLTVLVRMLFWPITHKSTESMKRMQGIQPEVKKLKEKYKDNPTKLNQATMALYKENKVNPMAGCLPLVIQIPVFFALFTVLRSAVELRFASFLWIADLSEQEGLLADVLPIPLNILPLVMTVLTLFQQKMTPSAGDPQQQKMMMFMPVMFLFLFYPMPSALVLYWTTSQLIALVQLLLQRRKKDTGLKPAPA